MVGQALPSRLGSLIESYLPADTASLAPGSLVPTLLTCVKCMASEVPKYLFPPSESEVDAEACFELANRSKE